MRTLRIIGIVLLASAAIMAAILAGAGLLWIEESTRIVGHMGRAHVVTVRDPHWNWPVVVPLVLAALTGCFCLKLRIPEFDEFP